uniref:BLTX232 n=1 Tax=Nephila pilipes TaxID=299642 RepID=A0A076L248_NEPPI|nr:BLTX232 [Nephila pilipes]AII97664.1 BLTX274 [Nephila pilipes]
MSACRCALCLFLRS